MSEPNPETPETAPATPNRGGTHTHKPGCGCFPCKARRRKAEAQLGTTGTGGDLVVSDSPQVVEADLQILESPARPNSHRQRIADWLAMRALEPEITLAEAAKRMGIAKSTLVTLIQRANKAGWLKFDDPLARMEHEIVPKVVDGLKKLLDEGDRQTIIETAKGTIFKQYQDAKGLNTQQAQTILAIKFDIPTGEMVKQVASGVVVGRPRFIEGEVEDEQ